MKIHRHIFVFFAVALLLSVPGCITQPFRDISSGLRALEGKPIGDAFDVLGYPDDKKQFGGEDVYFWNHRRDATTFTTSPLGGLQTHTFNYEYQIKLVVDKAQIIRKSEHYGDLGGAERYSRKLRKYADEHPMPKQTEKITTTP